MPLKFSKLLIGSLAFIIFFDFVFFSYPVLASQTETIKEINEKQAEIKMITDNSAPALLVSAAEQDPEMNYTNKNKQAKVKWTATHVATAYNSEAAQCDDSPCITANGFNVCEHGHEDTIAANFLPFNTKVRIPDEFGDRIFVVRDRMNKRYSDRIDIWMKDKQSAKNFGVRQVKIEVLQ